MKKFEYYFQFLAFDYFAKNPLMKQVKSIVSISFFLFKVICFELVELL